MADMRLQIVLGTIDKATAPMRKILGGSQAMSESLKNSRAALKTLQDTSKNISSFQKTRAELKSISRQYDESTAKLATLRLQLDAQRGSQQQMAGQVKTARDAFKLLSVEMARTSAPSEALHRTYQQQKAELEKLNARYNSSQSSLRSYKQQIKNTEQASKKLGEKQTYLKDKLGRVKTTLERAGIGTAQMATRQRALRGEIAQTNTQIEQQAQRLNKLAAARERADKMHAGGQRLVGTGLGMAYGGRRVLGSMTRSIAPGLEFDRTMSEVQALARLDKDSEDMQRLRADARAKGASTLFSATEVGQGQAFLARAGFDPDAILASTQAMLDIALAGKLDLSAAADITTNISTAFGIDSKDTAAMAQFADQLVTGFTTANVTLEDLGETMKYFAPIAKAGGVDTATSIAMAGMLGNVGIQGSMAGTTLREMTSRMASLPKPALDALKDLGVKTKTKDGQLRNIVEVIAEIDAAFQKRGTQNGDKLKYLNEIFGKRAMTGMSDMVEKMGDGSFQQYAEVVRNSEGNARKVAAIMGDNLTGDLDQLLSAARDVSIGLFDAMDPVLRELSQSITGLIRNIGQWIKDNPHLAKTIGLIAGGATALATALGGVALAGGIGVMAFSHLYKAAALLGNSMSGLGGLLSGAGNAARMLLPVLGGISAPMLAIGAAVAAVAFVVWKYWEPIKAFMIGVWQGLSEAMRPVMAAFGEALAPLIPLWDLLASGISAVWGWIKQLFVPFEATSEQLQAATGYGQAFGRGLGEILTWLLRPLRVAVTAIGWVAKLIGWVAGGVIDHWDSIKQALSWTPLGLIVTHWEPIKTFLSALWDVVWGTAVSAWDLIVGVIKGAWDVIEGIFTGDAGRVMDGLTGIWESIWTFMSGWQVKMFEWGKDMLKGLVNGILSMDGAVSNALTGVLGAAVGSFTSLLKINSPSRLFAGFGNSTMEGYALGIVRTHLHLQRLIAGQHLHAVEVGLRRHAVDFRRALLDFRLDRFQIGLRV